MILASGLPYAFLRMNLFLDDLPLWFDPDGVCRGPGGDGRVALISREDTAAVSAGVLVGPGYENEALDLTGEESLSLGELAALCNEVLGLGPALRARHARGLARGAHRRRASRPGTRTSASAPTRRCSQGEFDMTSQVVRRVTGRPAESVRAWVEAIPALRTARRRARRARAEE